MPNFGYDEVWYALEESLKLQAHYAELLNNMDGGQRRIFAGAHDWLVRLRAADTRKEREARRTKRNHERKS